MERMFTHWKTKNNQNSTEILEFPSTPTLAHYPKFQQIQSKNQKKQNIQKMIAYFKTLDMVKTGLTLKTRMTSP